MVEFTSGAGLAEMQILSRYTGDMTAQGRASDGAALLDSFSENAVSGYAADNSAIFLALMDLRGSNIAW